jgi:hypothetical protein
LICIFHPFPLPDSRGAMHHKCGWVSQAKRLSRLPQVSWHASSTISPGKLLREIVLPQNTQGRTKGIYLFHTFLAGQKHGVLLGTDLEERGEFRVSFPENTILMTTGALGAIGNPINDRSTDFRGTLGTRESGRGVSENYLYLHPFRCSRRFHPPVFYVVTCMIR